MWGAISTKYKQNDNIPDIWRFDGGSDRFDDGIEDVVVVCEPTIQWMRMVKNLK